LNYVKKRISCFEREIKKERKEKLCNVVKLQQKPLRCKDLDSYIYCSDGFLQKRSIVECIICSFPLL
jgi:hypothetical protein